jgi:hypothetical protein
VFGEQSPSVQGKRSPWTAAAVALTFAALSVAAVADRAAGSHGFIPWPIENALAWFIEPGLAVWWFTLGGVFQSFPYTLSGYAMTVGGNVAFWQLGFLLARSIFRRLRSGASEGGPR